MHFTDYRCPARYAALSALLAWLENQGVQAGLDGDETRRLQLVVEELFANTIEHGFGEESDRPVAVAVAFLPDGVVIDYRDEAPPFNPLAQDPTAGGAKAIGGHGLNILASLARTMDYECIDGRNSIRIELPRVGK